MKAVRCVPGLTYYLMALLALAWLAYGVAALAGLWELKHEFAGLVFSVLGFVGLGALALGWHAFTATDAGLHVRDLRGARMHRWEDLGQPRRRDFSRDGESFAYLRPRGPITEEAHSHLICDARGRLLYRLGPWYPLRRHLLSELRRRLRGHDARR